MTQQIRYFSLIIILIALYPFESLFSSPFLLKEHDEIAVSQALVSEISDFPIHTVTLIGAGWNNLVAEVNEEWIFRFPRSEKMVYTLGRECRLLECLKNHITLSIPNYEYTGRNVAFVGYRKIAGVELTKKLYLQLSPEKRKEIAESLAHFLTELHRCLPVNEMQEWGYDEYHLPLDKIENSLSKDFFSQKERRVIEEALDYAKTHPPLPETFVLLHTDLHGGNMAYDISEKKINGVFDFSDIAIGNYAIDFGKLFCIHADLAWRSIQAYERLNSVDVSPKEVAVDYILRRVLYILDAKEYGILSHELILRELLEEFTPIWDAL